MRDFQIEPNETRRLPSGTVLVVPGGIRVPRDYPYVETRDHLVEKCEAAWSTFEGGGLPLSFRLVGRPGVGKNAAVYALASRRDQVLYMLLGNEELTAEDLVVSAALRSNGEVEYVASPLLAAMLNGGICFLDEIAKMRPRALAPLASVLDSRRSVYSALLGETFVADTEFRFCAAYNQTDADAFDLAPWLRRRTLPELEVSPPDWDTLETIVRSNNEHDASLWHRIQQSAIAKNLQLDAGTALRLVSYAKRLEALSVDRDVQLGDPIDVAFDHILGFRGDDSESQEED